MAGTALSEYLYAARGALSRVSKFYIEMRNDMSYIKIAKVPLKKRVVKQLRKHWFLYLLMIPVVAWFLIFKYYPMYGVSLAFKDYNAKLGIIGSPWIGFKNFGRLFNSYNFPLMFRNTLGISLYSLVVGFTIPIVFALMLNYINWKPLKKTVQMLSYAPHFLSTVVVCSMLSIFTAMDSGIFNIIIGMLGFDQVNFMGSESMFKDLYVWSGVWQQTGWNAIIYISALAGVDPELHEAAIIDGASKIQRMRHVDIPSIKATIIMLLILRIGSIMSVGFEKVYLLQNPLNYKASLTISTYVYEVGLLDGDYSFSTAVGLFNNVINVIMLLSANLFSKKVMQESLF